MEQARGREPVVVAVGLDAGAPELKEAALRLADRPRIVATHSFEEGIREIQAQRAGDLRLVFFGAAEPDEVLRALPKVRIAGDPVRVPIIVLGTPEPDLVDHVETLGASSFLSLPEEGDRVGYLECTLRYWLGLNMVPLKNR